MRRPAQPHSLGFDVQTGSGPASNSVSNRAAAWIAVRRSSPRAGVREAVRHVWRADDHVSPTDDERLIAELERGLPGLDHEDLRVGVPMQLRADAGFGVSRQLFVRLDDRRQEGLRVGADRAADENDLVVQRVHAERRVLCRDDRNPLAEDRLERNPAPG